MRVVLVAILLLSAGCLGGTSKKEMEQDLALAIQDFRTDVLPGGALSHIAVSGEVSIEVEVFGSTGTATINPEMSVQLGDAGDILIDGKAVRLKFTAYCSPERLIAITNGGQDYDIPDTSSEMRNHVGFCTGPGSEDILLEFFDFELIDPALLTGDLDLEAMRPVTFEDNGKQGITGVYETDGPEGITTLTITALKGQITKIVSSNDHSNLVLAMTYGPRSAIDPPVATQRIPSPVTGAVERSESGWTWTGQFREGGPLAEYEVHVFEKGTSVPCSDPPRPIVVFALADGVDQNKEGYTFLLADDGDGTLGDGDQLLLRRSGVTGTFDEKVEIFDAWAGQRATLGCATPGPGLAFTGLAILGALAIARRRP